MDEARELRLKRGKEREAFSIKMRDKFFSSREKRDCPETFEHHLALTMLAYLRDRNLGIRIKDIESAEKKHWPICANTGARDFFYYTLFPEIFAFKETDQEMDVIIAKLLGEVTRSIQRPIFLKLGIVLGY